MPIFYTCKKCTRNYSKKQYAKRVYCRICGNLLLSQFVIDPEIKDGLTKNSNWEKKSVKKNLRISSKQSFFLDRVAHNLNNRIKTRKEYLLFSRKEVQKKPNVIEKEQYLYNSEYEDALDLKRKLTKKFEKKTLKQAIPGKTISNNHGEYYSIESISESGFKKINNKKCTKILISDLKLLQRIGPKRESHLKKNGYATIEDLKNHPIWKKSAFEFINLIEKKQIGALQSYLWKSLPKSHPYIHYLAGLCKIEDFAIVDIETLGLSERPIILMGIAQIRKNGIYTNQFLLRDITDEPSAIWAFVSCLKKECSLISYNGRSFDLPYVQQRLAYYGLDAPINNPHFDLLHFSRRAFGSKLNNCRLETVEKYLNIGRGVNVPGALVPDFYQTYLSTGNVGPLVAIVEHNKQDLVTLATLFSRLYEEWKI
ncbi:ribonuclease H-like domain-containing protein [Candidatus Bathyarchaeota archaeon]|nr:ribonuclease H-like domain-containing protein [Candidatus Bathyarchaeota archaeon]